MIIDFSIRNYLSIRDEITLSFLSNNKNIRSDLKTIPFDRNDSEVYSFSAIYGPNASGKTNIFKGLSNLIQFILFSNSLNKDNPIPAYDPFKLDKNFIDKPVGFEIEFIKDNQRYLYIIDFTKYEVINERLYYYPEGRKAVLFIREKNKEIKYGTYFTGKKKILETFLLRNKLYLSVVANSTNDVLNPVYNFFRDDIKIHVQMDSSFAPFHSTTHELINENSAFKNTLIKILKSADLNIADIKLVEDKNVLKSLKLPDDMPENIRSQIINDFKFKPYIGHIVYDNEKSTNKVEYFNFNNEESTGTVKMYDISGEVINSLQKGTTLFIDEFNSGLHPYLNQLLVELFINPKINRNNAQLLISTHDTCVLDMSKLKREQIWFTDKNKFGVTELFSLDEFEDKNIIRDYSKYSKFYLDGRFRAVPKLNINELISGILPNG
ncbi:MAG: ATP-binding protein [Caldisericia bacterium]|nr:ATP-binding protein [Caldisericia bacterium]